MDSRVSSTMEAEIEVVKRIWAILKEGDLVWLVDESLERSEYMLGQFIEIFFGSDGFVQSASESQNGTWRAETAFREVSASFLQWCLPDQKHGGNVAASSNQLKKSIRGQELFTETETT